jgi:hypothetical protein
MVPFSENGSLKREHNPKNPNRSAQPLSSSASGQGINSIGAIVAKGLKRSGCCVFGYREYPSLIKGGHASYQLDISKAEQLG